MELLAYIRVSTPKQLEEKTHLTQEYEIKKWCETNGHTIIKWYKDLAVSGEAVYNRPSYQNLLVDIQEKGDGVIAYKLSRLGRSSQDLLFFVDFITKECKKQLHLVKEKIDTSTPMGRFFLKVLAAFVEFDRETILENIESGRQRALAEGRKIGGPIEYDIPKKFVLKYLKLGLSPEKIGNILEIERTDENGKTVKIHPSGSTIRRRMKEWGIYESYKRRELY